VRSSLGRALGLAVLLVLLSLALPPFAAAQDSLDLDKALKIGSGRIMVIEFTDPDCPYCRKAEAWFADKPQVTRYVFFIPLASHPASKGKIQYILSAKDKLRAYREVLAGRFDAGRLAEVTPEGIRLQKEHQEIAKANKMTSTPSFMIYGRIVEGFDLKRLEPLIR
jgi:thiol:disulfide interchange protein DsbC